MIYFGTDGIRGIVNEDLTQELCMKCGNALSSIKKAPKIIIGTDTRTSGSFLFSSFCCGATLGGAKIFYVGIVPTPAISFLVQKHKADYGVMITASHNPANYNGIKIFNQNGEKISVQAEKEIEKLFFKQKIINTKRLGKILFKKNWVKDYINHLKKIGNNLSGLKVAIDCCNGASYLIAAKVFRQLGCKVFKLNCQNKGTKINEECGALFPQYLANYTQKNHCDVGFAYDGDADRIVAIDENGQIINGDQILLFLTKMYKRFNKLKTTSIVATVQSNMALENELTKMGIKLLRTDVGDKNVTNEMIKNKLQIGGEQAGHIVLADYGKTGDGIQCALIISRFVKESKQRFSENLFYDLYNQYTKNIIVNDKYKIINSIKVKQVISKCENALKGKGRLVVRASGTEPKIRILVECQEKALAEKTIQLISDSIETN